MGILVMMNSENKQMKPYQYAGYKNVFRTGLAVDEVAARLRRFAYIEERLMWIESAWLVETPERDFKLLLSRLQYVNGRHADGLRQRLIELRVGQASALVTCSA